MRVLAIDPGHAQSAWMHYEDGVVLRKGIDPNKAVIDIVYNAGTGCARAEDHSDHFAIEMIESMGMAVGVETFETVFWIGKFCECWERRRSSVAFRVYRKDVKMHLCRSMRAKDTNIRQALIDMFGGSAAVGKKKEPGPLFGISKDLWSALAIAVTFSDLQDIYCKGARPTKDEL